MTWPGEASSNMETQRRSSVSKALDVVRRGSISTAVGLVRRNSQLSLPQLERLKNHKYSASGSSLSEVFMQPFWRWLVTKVPLWVAPNLLTFVGFVLNILTTLPVALWDMNMMGVAPRWTYLLCALGFFIYQSLDAIDGKQARRTGTNSPLGEFFDHGCDAVSTYLVVVSAACAIGGGHMPTIVINFVILYLVLNFAYHWQTYVSGVLHFKKFDVTEGQFAHIFILLITGTFGVDFWGIEFPGTGVSFREFTGIIVLLIGAVNFLHAFHVILTRGAGHNGSTVANTSVLSPIITMAIMALPTYFYAYHSNFVYRHSVIFFTALSLPMCKAVMYIVVTNVTTPAISDVIQLSEDNLLAGMTKSPFPLLDHIMLGPLFACLNLYLGTPVPEMYLLQGLALYNIVDICVFSVVLVQQICDYLNISCFTIPHGSTDDNQETVKT